MATAMTAAYSRLRGSLILRHAGGAISHLRLPWMDHDCSVDIPDPTIPNSNKDSDNLLAINGGAVIWGATLVAKQLKNQFSTLNLPLPSSFPTGENEHFMQLMVFPNLYRGWYSIYNKMVGVDKYSSGSTVKFHLEPLIYANTQVYKPYEITNFEYFDGCVESPVAYSLSDSSEYYERDSEMLGKGLQGQTYIGYCVGTRRKVVLKKFTLPLILANGEAREVFFSKNISHNYIRDMDSAWVDESGTCWMALNHRTRTFDDCLDDNKAFDLMENFTVLVQVGKAVDYMHGSLIVHVDVEPQNVLYDEDGVAVLADLGSCVMLEKGAKCKPAHFQSWKPHYAAPELFWKREFDEKVDSYSFGMLTFTALSSRCTPMERLSKVLQLKRLAASAEFKRNPLLEWYKSGLSSDFHGNNELLTRMISSDPKLRPGFPEILKKLGENDG